MRSKRLVILYISANGRLLVIYLCTCRIFDRSAVEALTNSAIAPSHTTFTSSGSRRYRRFILFSLHCYIVPSLGASIEQVPKYIYLLSPEITYQ
jgi:hypothetical protein